MAARRRLGAAALALAAASLAVLTPTQSARADDANRECDNGQDITVVVDFQELIDGDSNDVNVRCAPQPVDSGFAALTRANISFSTYRGFLCRIAGLPDASDESCSRYPPADAYWVYWYAEPGGQWTYSQTGAGARTPPPGSFEGWSFAKNRDAGSLPPPRYPTPKVITHPTTAPTAAPATNPPSASTATTRAARAASTSTSAPNSSAVATTSASTSTIVTVIIGVDPLTPTSIALGHVDLSQSQSDGGSPLLFFIGVGVVGAVAVVGGGAALSRSRRVRRLEAE